MDSTDFPESPNLKTLAKYSGSLPSVVTAISNLPTCIIINIFAQIGSTRSLRSFFAFGATSRFLRGISQDAHSIAEFIINSYGTPCALLFGCLYFNRLITREVVAVLKSRAGSFPRHVLQKLMRFNGQETLEICADAWSSVLKFAEDQGYSEQELAMNDDLEFETLVIEFKTASVPQDDVVLKLQQFLEQTRYSPSVWDEYHNDKLNVFTYLVPGFPPPSFRDCYVDKITVLSLLIKNGTDIGRLSKEILTSPTLLASSIPNLIKAGLRLSPCLIKHMIRFSPRQLEILASYVNPKCVLKTLALAAMPLAFCETDASLFLILQSSCGPFSPEEIYAAISTEAPYDTSDELEPINALFPRNLRRLRVLPRPWVTDMLISYFSISHPIHSAYLEDIIFSIKENGDSKLFLGLPALPVLGCQRLGDLVKDFSLPDYHQIPLLASKRLILAKGFEFSKVHLKMLLHHSRHFISENLVSFVGRRIFDEKSSEWAQECGRGIMQGLQQHQHQKLNHQQQQHVNSRHGVGGNASSLHGGRYSWVEKGLRQNWAEWAKRQSNASK